LAPDIADLNFDRSGEAGALAIYHVPPDTSDPQAYRPQLISKTSDAMKWGAPAQYARQYMGRSGRLTETEAGVIPADAPASALQISREESGEIRKPRVEALAKTYQKLHRHRLQLMQKYVIEPRVAWDKQANKRDVQRWFKGADFEGQTDVVIDVEGAADTDLLKQRKIDDALKQGLVDVTNPVNRRILGRLKGLPADLYMADDIQDQVAEREYLELVTIDGEPVEPESPGGMRFGRPPVVDDGIDDHGAHVFRHSKDINSDLWREIERAVNWDKIVVAIAGWKRQAIMAMTPEQEQPKAVPGMPPPPPAPPLPPDIDLLTPTPQIFIVKLWAEMITMAAGDPNNPLSQAGIDPADPSVLAVLSFRAHHAEHKMRMAFGQAQQAQAAPPPPAA
jgi:hypothetical protein